MNKYLLFVILLTSFFISPSYASNRNLTTPIERLKGHWVGKLGTNDYYGEIKANGIGSYITVQPSGRKFHHKYKVTNQIKNKDLVNIVLIFSDGDKRAVTIIISKDGKNLKNTTEILDLKTTTQYKYVNGKTTP